MATSTPITIGFNTKPGQTNVTDRGASNPRPGVVDRGIGDIGQASGVTYQGVGVKPIPPTSGVSKKSVKTVIRYWALRLVGILN